MSEQTEARIPQGLLDILVCPACKNPLALNSEQDRLHCTHCRVAYPIRDGIPVLLVDQAVRLAS